MPGSTTRRTRMAASQTAAISVAVAMLFAACGAGSGGPSDDVLQYKGGPGRTGEARASIPGEPTILWTVRTDGPIDSSPAVRDGVAHIVGGDRRLHAIDVETGTTRWSAAATDHVGSPAVAGDRIVVLGVDGSISALEPSGKPAWTTASRLAERSAPLVLGDMIVSGGPDGTLRGFSVVDGVERWAVPTGGELPRAAAGLGSVAFIGSHDGSLYAIDATDGSNVWTVDIGADHFATPAVRDGSIYVMAAGPVGDELLALDAATGVERWRFTPPDGTSMHSPSVDASTVYISSMRHVYALSPTDGSIVWAYEGQGWNTAGLAVTPETVYAFAEGGTLYALDADTGDRRWNVWVGSDVPSGTTLSDGRIIVGTQGGDVLAVGSSPG